MNEEILRAKIEDVCAAWDEAGKNHGWNLNHARRFGLIADIEEWYMDSEMSRDADFVRNLDYFKELEAKHGCIVSNSCIWGGKGVIVDKKTLLDWLADRMCDFVRLQWDAVTLGEVLFYRSLADERYRKFDSPAVRHTDTPGWDGYDNDVMKAVVRRHKVYDDDLFGPSWGDKFREALNWCYTSWERKVDRELRELQMAA